jgi:hypothetical protein
MEYCPICGGWFEKIDPDHYKCDTCELGIRYGEYVVENENDMSYHVVRVIGDKIYDPEIISVSDKEITLFLDHWLVDASSLKHDQTTINMLTKLLPHFKFEGTLVRGLYTPYVQIIRNGVDQCIESWSKSNDGLRNVEQFSQIAFGLVNEEDGKVQTYSPEQFVKRNAKLETESFDKIIEGQHTGIDLVTLAQYVRYRSDFLQKLEEAEEVLILQKVKK